MRTVRAREAARGPATASTGALRRWWAARVGADPECGSMTIFFAITVLGLLLLVGLIVDGGAKLRATQRADAVAAETARAAGQVLDLPAAVAGEGASVDVVGAVAAASAYLDAAGLTGSIQIADDRTHLAVTTTAESPTVFLGLIGVPTVTVTGHAEVQLVHAISGSAP